MLNILAAICVRILEVFLQLKLHSYSLKLTVR